MGKKESRLTPCFSPYLHVQRKNSWLCCMIICGPFLILWGVSTVGNAALGDDERLIYIDRYNTIVDTWNGASGAADFKGVGITLKVEPASASYPSAVEAAATDCANIVTTTVDKITKTNVTKTSAPFWEWKNITTYKNVTTTGACTSTFTEYSPDDFPTTGFPDKVLRKDKETFTKVGARVAYKVALTRTESTYAAGFKIARTKVTLGGTSGLTDTFEFDSVIEIAGRNLKYNWYVGAGSSAQPSSISCKAPSAVYSQYPGTRFNGMATCDQWCKSNNGKWSGPDTKGSKCYPSSMAKDKAPKTDTGCCVVPKTYAGLKEINLVVNCATKTSCKIGSTLTVGKDKTADTNNALSFAKGGSMAASPDFTSMPFTQLNYDLENTMRSPSAGDYPPLIYSTMGDDGTKYNEWKKDIKLMVSIRSDKDPYYAASTINPSRRGCVSGTDFGAKGYTELYTTFAYKANDQCFGSTPGQKASSGVMLIIIGSIILSPFCCIFCVVKAMGNKRAEKDPTRGWKTDTANPAASGAPPSVIEMVA